MVTEGFPTLRAVKWILSYEGPLAFQALPWPIPILGPLSPRRSLLPDEA